MKELVEWEKKYKDEKEAVDQASVNLTEKKKKLAKLTKRLAAEEKRSVDFEQELSSFQKSYGKLFEKYVVVCDLKINLIPIVHMFMGISSKSFKFIIGRHCIGIVLFEWFTPR